MSSAIERLKKITDGLMSYETKRKHNMQRLHTLYEELDLSKKVEIFENLFTYKAINLSGASLNKENLGETKEGKYLQILAITYNKDASVKTKNISLAYFGRAESVEESLKERVVEFIMRYRFEKSFLNLEHYNSILDGFSKEDLTCK